MRKRIIAILSLVVVMMLSGCSVGGIKIIEKSGQSGEDSNVRTFKHAGYIFEETKTTMYTKNAAPASDALDDTGSIVRSLAPGESVEIIGIDTTNEYAVFEDGDSFLFVRMADLTKTPPGEEEIEEVDKDNLSKIIDIANKVIRKSDSYEEEGMDDVKANLKKAKEYFDSDSASQEEVNKIISELKSNIEALTKKDNEPEPTPAPTPTPEPEPEPDTTGLGIPYPAAPDSVDIFDGVTFAILSNVNAEVVVPGQMYNSSSMGADEVGNLKQGDKVKVLAIGTNDFARIETSDGKVGFIKSTSLKKK